jgi:hypothetical protein
VQDAEFSDEFCAFLQNATPTVDAAELLLVVARHPEAEWDPQTLVDRKPPDLTITPADAASYLEMFLAQGLLAQTAEMRGARFQPATPALAAHVTTLAKAYNERPVTLIRMIYALRDAKIHSFSDAFKLRKT